MSTSNIKKLTAKLDIVADSIEKKRPELALALDLISDRLEKMAAIPAGVVKLHKEYMRAGGESSLTHFLDEDIPGFLDYLGKSGGDIWNWDKSKGPASKK